jgi:hypothetical protein
VVPVLAYSLAVAGTLITEPTDTFIAGVHLITGEGPAIATPATTGADTDGDVASIIDALSGRGIVEDALAGTDPDVVHRVGALARRLQP